MTENLASEWLSMCDYRLKKVPASTMEKETKERQGLGAKSLDFSAAD